MANGVSRFMLSGAKRCMRREARFIWRSVSGATGASGAGTQTRFLVFLLKAPKQEWAAACRGRVSARRPNYLPVPASLPCDQREDSFLPFPLHFSAGTGKKVPPAFLPRQPNHSVKLQNVAGGNASWRTK